MDIFKEILNFLESPGGIVFFVTLIVFIVVLVFKKPLEDFVRTLIKIKFRGLEMEATGITRGESKNSDISLSEYQGIKIQTEMDNEANQSFIEESSENNNLNESEGQQAYSAKLFKCYENKDVIKMKAIYCDFMKNVSNKNDQIKLEAQYYSCLYMLGEDVAHYYTEIEKKAYNTAAYGDVMLIIARSFRDMEEYNQTKIYLEKGLNYVNYSSPICVNLFKGLADTYFNLGEHDKAFNLLLTEINKPEISDKYKFDYYYTLATLYKRNDDNYLYIYALEKALSVKPNDKRILFSLGYSYSQIDYHELAVLYYEKLLKIDDSNSSAINNLGVLYSKLNMKCESTNFYEEASNLGNTLATANLAYKYINLGLLDKAEEILKNAQKQEKVHKNVNEALLKIEKLRKKESEEKLDVMNQADELKNFFNELATARFEEYVITSDFFKQKWYVNNKVVQDISIKDEQISIILDDRKLTGKFVNRYFEFNLYELEYYPPFSEESERAEYREIGMVFGYMDSSGSKIYIIEQEEDNTYGITTLKRNDATVKEKEGVLS